MPSSRRPPVRLPSFKLHPGRLCLVRSDREAIQLLRAQIGDRGLQLQPVDLQDQIPQPFAARGRWGNRAPEGQQGGRLIAPPVEPSIALSQVREPCGEVAEEVVVVPQDGGHLVEPRQRMAAQSPGTNGVVEPETDRNDPLIEGDSPRPSDEAMSRIPDSDLRRIGAQVEELGPLHESPAFIGWIEDLQLGDQRFPLRRQRVCVVTRTSPGRHPVDGLMEGTLGRRKWRERGMGRKEDDEGPGHNDWRVDPEAQQVGVDEESCGEYRRADEPGGDCSGRPRDDDRNAGEEHEVERERNHLGSGLADDATERPRAELDPDAVGHVDVAPDDIQRGRLGLGADQHDRT